MRVLCHRCERELPDGRTGGDTRTPSSQDDVPLFCPFCAAPQLRLPEYLHTQNAPLERDASTGALPPPRPAAQPKNFIDWRLVYRLAAVVGLCAALIRVLSLVAPSPAVQAFAGLVDFLLVLCGAVLVVGLYARRSPGAPLNALLGMRIGVVAGLLMVVARVLALAVLGVTARFVTHAMGPFDAQMAHQAVDLQSQMMAQLQDQSSGKEVREKLVGMLGSPEIRGGMVLAVVGFMSLMTILFSAAGGAFAGLLRTPRPGLRPSE